MHSPIAATALLEPIPRSPIHSKAAARFPAAFRALFRFPTRTVQKPQEVVILVTIMACLMVETDDGVPSGFAFAQAVRCRRRHQPRRPPLAKIRPNVPKAKAC